MAITYSKDIPDFEKKVIEIVGGITPPTPPVVEKIMCTVTTKSTSGADASVSYIVKQGETTLDSGDILYSNVDSEAKAKSILSNIKIYYADVEWIIKSITTDGVIYNNTYYYVNDVVRRWAYDATIGFSIEFVAVPSPSQESKKRTTKKK